MIRVAKGKKASVEAIEYIDGFGKNVPYLYINLRNFNEENPNVTFWIDEERNGIQGIYLRYYDCLHFFTRENAAYPCSQFYEMLSMIHPKVIMVQEAFGKRIERELGTRYHKQKSHIVDLSVQDLTNRQDDKRIEFAGIDDFERIADLMLNDPIFCNIYDKATLIAQLIDRYEEGFSRTFMIRDQTGEIAAAYSTYGECSDLAVLSGLIVDPKQRRKGLATAIVSHACGILKEENKEMISMLDDRNTATLSFHMRLGVGFLSSINKFVSIR